jgi:hypothetical protein
MNPCRRVLGLFLPLALLTNISQSAAAEDATAADPAQSAAVDANDGSSVRGPFEDKWKFQVGAGVINGARYPGSRYDFNRGLPLLSISYDRYFIGGAPGSGASATD